LSKGWLEDSLSHSKDTYWDVLGNRLLNPDGTRHWDRATLKPHKMVDYDHPQFDKNLYQTSGFIMVRRDVFEAVRWDDECLVHGDQEGGLSEDVRFSLDLISNGYQLSFDDSSTVWHNDDSYTQVSDYCLKKETLDDREIKYTSVKADEFLNLLGDST